jgi:hypothetical protein
MLEDYDPDEAIRDEDEDPDGLNDDEVETEPCPHCGVLVYEEAEQCPHCGEYIVRSTSPFHGRSAAWILLGLLGIVAVLYTMFAWLPGM